VRNGSVYTIGSAAAGGLRHSASSSGRRGLDHDVDDHARDPRQAVLGADGDLDRPAEVGVRDEGELVAAAGHEPVAPRVALPPLRERSADGLGGHGDPAKKVVQRAAAYYAALGITSAAPLRAKTSQTSRSASARLIGSGRAPSRCVHAPEHCRRVGRCPGCDCWGVPAHRSASCPVGRQPLARCNTGLPKI
jgi:hypothetical protein